MKVALVHDWVVTIGGAERCLQAFHELYPMAPLYTLVYNEESLKKLGFDPYQVNGSIIQRFPNAQMWYRKYLPFFPMAVEQFDLSEYDLILSSSHAAAKGVLTRADQLHICYCHTPIRYAWDLTHEYLRENSLEKGFKSCLARAILHYIRMWDLQTANRVDFFLTNSHHTASRIWRTYRRNSTVIYGPIDIERFQVVSQKEDFFLFVSRLVPYKKADLVIEVFNKLGLKLKVIGDGPQYSTCRKLAGANVQLLGYQDDNTVSDLLGKARALIFPAEEDLGLIPIEAQACGTPVIAYGKGGIEDTVIPANGVNWAQATGVFFYKQNQDELQSAIKNFLLWEGNFRPYVIRKNAERFSKERFKERLASFVQEKWNQFNEKDWRGLNANSFSGTSTN